MLPKGDVMLSEMDDAKLLAMIQRCGSNVACARELGVSETTVRRALRIRGLSSPTVRPAVPRRPMPTLSRESLHAALLPPNNCRVRLFLESLDDGSREIVEEALAYDKQDFPAAALREWLIREGFRESDVPGASAINDHRNGRRPCRCRG